jgi:hypothetical protein
MVVVVMMTMTVMDNYHVYMFQLEKNQVGLLKLKKLNSVALVRKRTIPTERPPLSAK